MVGWCLKQLATSKIINLDHAQNLVGRNNKAQMCLSNVKISRFHAYLFVHDGDLSIQDLKSVNGTFLNGKQIPVYKTCKVAPGDTISFGMPKTELAESSNDKECFFEVLQKTNSENAVTSETVQLENQTSMTNNSNDGLSELVISVPNHNQEFKLQPASRRPQRCSARKAIIVNEQLAQIESDKKVSSPKAVIISPRDNHVTSISGKNGDISEAIKKKPLAQVVPNEDLEMSISIVKTDSPIVIDLTDKDDDIDFSCSQMLQMSQIVCDRVSDDDYQKIKNELAEMDYCSEEMVVNACPIDLDEDNSGGFNNTQEICAVLEDKVEPHLDDQGVSDLVSLFEDDEVVETTKAEQISEAKCSPATTKPALLKRKHSLELSVEKKKRKSSPPKKNSYTQKDFHNELKRRYSCGHDSRVEKDSVKEERRKKLKELSGGQATVPIITIPTQSFAAEVEPSPHPKIKRRISGQPTVTSVLGMEISYDSKSTSKELRDRRKSLNTHEECKPKKSSTLTRSKSLSRENGLSTLPDRLNIEESDTKYKKSSLLVCRKSLSRDCKMKESLTKGVQKRQDTKERDSLKSRTEVNKSKKERSQKEKLDIKAETRQEKNKRGKLSSLETHSYTEASESASTSSNTDTQKRNSELPFKDKRESNVKIQQEQNKQGISPKLKVDSHTTSTSCTPDGPKRKRGRPPKRNSDSDLKRANFSDSTESKQANTGGSGSYIEQATTSGETTSCILNSHSRDPRIQSYQKPGVNTFQQLEASKLSMWSKKPINNRRLPNVNEIIAEMVHWIPNRFLEETLNGLAAPIINLPKKIPATFQNFQEYYDTFSKMVLLESWQCMFRSFRARNESAGKMKVQHARVVNNTLVLDCISYISKEDLKNGNYCKPEDFVMLECAMRDKTHVLNFGFVQSCRNTLVANGERPSINQLFNGPNPHTQLEFTVVTRYQRAVELNTNLCHLIKPLISIRTYLMLIRAMKEMEQSPLCSMILKPQARDFKFPVTHREVHFPDNTWNEEQKTIVFEAATLCMGNKPGIYCVKGPPGTGKTTVIVNLLKQILFSEKNRFKDGRDPMILLTAPSNAAVDNLIFKIGATRRSLSPELRSKIRLVRIGPESSIHKDVACYSLPHLAERHIPVKYQQHPEFQAAKKRKENLTDFAKKLFSDRYQNEVRQCERLIIEKSNIICTTLNSCINSRLIDAVNTGLIKFTCCIIDEATQCHEIESLLPIVLGIDKFVLVGDPQQLNATIMSREAVKRGFGESLFTRLANNFGLDPRSPIKMLTEQYRMHEEICHFPSKHFYEGKLRTKANPENKLPSKIRPYLVLNCEKISQSDDYTNMDEVILIRKLLKSLYDTLDRRYSYTIGIITPYNAQKDLLNSHIEQNEYCKVTINTVDSFQGSEKDIIIISCVRDSSNSFLQNPNRLNVALTRAKQALYIIGNYSLFKECPLLYDLREDAKKRKVLLDIKQNPRTIDSLQKYLIKVGKSEEENV